MVEGLRCIRKEQQPGGLIVPWCIAQTEMQVVEVLNPLAREFKSIGTLRKELD
jgi:hypothetical protein